MIGRLLRNLRRLFLGAQVADRVVQSTTLVHQADELLDTYEAELKLYDLRVRRMERLRNAHRNP